MPTQVNVAQFIDNETFKSVYKETVLSIKRFKDAEQQLFFKLLDDNIDGIADINTFLERGVQSFKQKTKVHLKMKPGYGALVWKKINKTLTQQAQKLQFGDYLSSLDMNVVDKDYHHILKVHIHNGNKHNITNVFRFFGKVVHYCDTSEVVAKCPSVQRKADRAKAIHMFLHDDGDHKEVEGDNHLKNIWTLKQYYTQSQLDIIHSYLVHSGSKRMAKLYTMPSQENEDNKQDIDGAINEEEDLMGNKNRYISFGADYGFGVMHEHHHLKPAYPSMYDEMMHHKECPLREITFYNLLTKAVMKHKIALNDEHIAQFVCKYYDQHYRILRNEPIGIRHIFALVAYTDMTDFCTVFRKTYRKIKDSETDEEVTKRHIELYHYSRGLFESIEFFGLHMKETLTVYHGLNRQMTFKRFTAFFNQPISTTSSFTSAQQFSTGSRTPGIILTLKSGARQFNKQSKIPKHLPVSWLSAYPNEEEKLFYGAHVVFKIQDIH
eukprot:291478_1